MLNILLILALVFCGSASAFSDDTDYSVWDSNRTYPADVLGTKLLTPVKFLMDRGIITGDTDGLFHPDKNINRAEYATMIAKATNNLAELRAMENEEFFGDLGGYTWAKAYINAVAKAGLFMGRSADMFAPGESVTYAEVITVLIRFNKGAADTAERMAPKWPDNYIAFANLYKTNGEVVVIDWNAPATRGDVARMLYRNMPKSSTSSQDVSVIVNGLPADFSGGNFSADIGKSADAAITITAAGMGDEIICNVERGANLGIGNGVLRVAVDGISTDPPFVIVFSVRAGSTTTTYRLTITGGPDI